MKNPLSYIKYPLLKAIDISGLTFLGPVVRLCYGEEPSVQMKKIGQWIFIPIIFIILFLFVWGIASEKIQTKSGALPNPTKTLQAYDSINTFAKREKLKKEAYEAHGEQREKLLTKAQERLAEIIPQAQAATELVTQEKANQKVKLASQIAPIKEEYKTSKRAFTESQKQRQTQLDHTSKKLHIGNEEQYQSFIQSVKEHQSQTETEKSTLRSIKIKIKEIENSSSKKVEKALQLQTIMAEEQQFLKKQIDQLTRDNKSLKVESEQLKIEENFTALTQVTGKEALKKAQSIVKTETRLEKTKASNYAKPSTLWFQVRRSILCVFTGFLLGSLIAIPIGILCGLSSTFMAAMTPFVAIFKPVSPIVWLPITLIIASGLIPDPDQNPLMKFLWGLPGELGEFKINPAFIASAATVALCSLWATLANTALGVASIDKDHLNVARVLKLGFWSRLFKIIIPSALPLIFAGLRISLGVGWMVLIAAELLSSSEGIGKFVWDQFNNGASDSFAKMIVVVFVVGVIGLILDRIMIIFQRMVSFEGSAATI